MPYVAILTAMFLWSSTFVVLKLVFAVFDPMVVLFARMLVASLCLGLLVWWRGGVRFDYRAGDWKWLLAMGLIEPCLYFLFEARALQYTSASQAGMITSAMPFLVALGAMLFLREKVSLHKWLGLCLSCAGIIWLTLGSHPDEHAPDPWLGNLLELAAMCCSAAFVLIVKKLSDRYSPLVMTGMPALMGCLWFGAGMLLPGVQLPQHYPLGACLLILYLGAGVTLGAYGLHIWAVTRVPVTVAASFNNLIPVMTVLSAWIVLGETLSLPQMLACALVLLGVLIGQRR
ncbi:MULTISPECIES: DMT family transporter [unclassified Paludibacterium]|uniref:DMT family transporter n=1 Tax=unclassified Paludibacterium TaxID=2618429 RepID=UPI001C04E2AB|nr:DMT family transporter [Paludibacterium sp. B53371]BEV73471.1 DMT family transporter [Paludibacterium sp. THUN1379]